MAFKIYLTNVKWDNSQKENIRFNSRNEQREYFNIPNIFTTSLPNVNFKINDGISAQAYYYSENTLANTLNYNYAIILDEQETNDSLKYKFYFVNRIIHDSSRKCYNLELFLDIIQTYYIDLVFDDCLINRAHLDRFDDNNKFNYTKTSKLYKKEDFNFNYPIINRYYDCKPSQSSDKNISLWLHKNVIAWAYYFIKQTSNISNLGVLKNDGTLLNGANLPTDHQIFQYRNNDETLYISNDEVSFTQKFFVLVAPIYKYNSKNRIKTNVQSIQYNYLSLNSIDKFLSNNNLSGNVLNVKLSRLSPFSNNFNISHYNLSIVDNNLIINRNNNNGGGSITDTYFDDIIFESNGLLLFNTKAFIYNELYLEYITYGINNEETINDIFVNDINPPSAQYIKLYDYEPKDNIFVEKLKISDGVNEYLYNKGELYDKFHNNYCRIKYIEVLSIDICRYFIYVDIQTDAGDVYYGKKGNFVGFVGSMDLSLPFSIDQLDNFLTNNKNFYMQYENKRNYRELGYAINEYWSMISGAITNNYVGATTSIIGSIYKSYGESVNLIDRDLSLQNLSLAPDNIENINGNPLLNAFYNELIIRIENVSCMETDKKTFDWYLKRYGYKYNELDNVKTVDHIRHYFNYVKCDIDNVNAVYGLSIALKDEIRKIFNNGICLWRYIQGQTANLFDYSVINYEEKYS